MEVLFCHYYKTRVLLIRANLNNWICYNTYIYTELAVCNDAQMNELSVIFITSEASINILNAIFQVNPCTNQLHWTEAAS